MEMDTCMELKCNLTQNKRLTLYDQNGKRWADFGSRQSKRQQSQNHQHHRIGTTDSYPYYGIKQKFVKVNRKARQLPQLCRKACLNLYSSKFLSKSKEAYPIYHKSNSK